MSVVDDIYYAEIIVRERGDEVIRIARTREELA